MVQFFLISVTRVDNFAFPSDATEQHLWTEKPDKLPPLDWDDQLSRKNVKIMNTPKVDVKVKVRNQLV